MQYNNIGTLIYKDTVQMPLAFQVVSLSIIRIENQLVSDYKYMVLLTRIIFNSSNAKVPMENVEKVINSVAFYDELSDVMLLLEKYNLIPEFARIQEFLSLEDKYSSDNDIYIPADFSADLDTFLFEEDLPED